MIRASKANTMSHIPRLEPSIENILEEQFSRVKVPRSTDLELLAAETGLPEAHVEAWYKNRLSIWRKEQGLSTNIQSFNN